MVTNEKIDAIKTGIGMIEDSSRELEERVKIALDLVDYISLKYKFSLDYIDIMLKNSEEMSTRDLIKETIVDLLFSKDEEAAIESADLMIEFLSEAEQRWFQQ